MKRFIAILLLYLPLAVGSSFSQDLIVTPLNGVDVNGERAIFAGNYIKYDLKLEDNKDYISAEPGSFSLIVGNNNYTSKCRVNNGVLTIDPIELLTVVGNNEYNFKLSYKIVKKQPNDSAPDVTDEKSEEDVNTEDYEDKTVSSIAKVTGYKIPNKKPDIHRNNSQTSAIAEGEFTFDASDFDDNQGYDGGWEYEWYVDNKLIKITHSKEDKFTNTFESAEEKTFNVQLKAINRINGSREEEGMKRLDSQEIPITIYRTPSLTITSLPDRVAGVDEKVEAIVNFIGGNPEGWSISEVIIDNNTVDFNCIPFSDNVATINFPYELVAADNEVEIEVQASNSHDTMLPYNDLISKKRSFRVYSMPTVTFNNLLGGKHIYESEELTCTPNGGNLDGWEYTWTIDDKPSNIKGNTFNASVESLLKEGEHTVEVEVFNKVSGTNYLKTNNKKTWKFDVWSAPSAPNVTADFVYYGEKALITVHGKGGYKGEGGGWKYKLLKNGKDFNEYKYIEDGGTLETDNIDSNTPHTNNTINAYSVMAVNVKADGSDWLDTPLTQEVNIRAYKSPKVEVTPEASDVYFNENVKANVNADFGVNDEEGAWQHIAYFSNLYESEGQSPAPTYNWDGWRQGDSEYSLDNMNEATEKRYISMAVISSNGTSGKRIYFANGKRCETKEEATFEAQNTAKVITVWPKINFGSEKTEIIKVREGDSFTVEVPKTTGGYYDAETGETQVKCIYSYDGKTFPETTNTEYSFETKYDASKNKWSQDKWTSDVTYTVYAMSPYGEKWDSKDYSQPVVVYSRPAAPSQVMPKGNGTSNSFVIMMPVSNNDLTARGYHFAFCSDSAVLKDGTERIAVLPGHTEMDVKATTYWTYPDGSVVYSDFLDCGHNKTRCTWSSFDGSGPHSRVTVDEMTEGIDSVVVDNIAESPVVHDLQGRRVTELQHGGMYVVNGKKIIFK